MPNPFIYEDAVPPEKFFDREKEIELFESQLRSGKRKMLLAVVGPLKFGKTSLMMRYLEIARHYDDIIPVYIDLRQETKPVRFIVEEASRALNMNFFQDYEAFKERPSKLFATINEELVRQNKWLFIFFDEFHLLPQRVRAEGLLRELSDEDVFIFFRGVAEGRRMSYIVCGSVVEALMDALAVWGGRFRLIYLGPFSKNDAIDMMRRLFAEAGMKVSEDFLEELCDAAGYHPFYMQFMGSVIYSMGRADRATLREAKRELIEYVRPIFEGYVERLLKLGKKYLEVLRKIAGGERISIDELPFRYRLYRMGLLVSKNGQYDLIDPLFKRYVLALDVVESPPDVTVVGHWAERIVGNYLLRKGYMPYYSHDSRGAFDIYVRIRGVDVGIQVRYSSSGEVRLTAEEAKKILEAAKETGWRPILALVSKDVEFFGDIRPGVYRAGEGAKDIEDTLHA